MKNTYFTITFLTSAAGADCASAMAEGASTKTAAVRGNVGDHGFHLWMPHATNRGYTITAYGSFQSTPSGTLVKVRFFLEPLSLVTFAMIGVGLVLLAQAHAWGLVIALSLFALIAGAFYARSARAERSRITRFIVETCHGGI